MCSMAVFSIARRILHIFVRIYYISRPWDLHGYVSMNTYYYIATITITASKNFQYLNRFVLSRFCQTFSTPNFLLLLLLLLYNTLYILSFFFFFFYSPMSWILSLLLDLHSWWFLIPHLHLPSFFSFLFFFSSFLSFFFGAKLINIPASHCMFKTEMIMLSLSLAGFGSRLL